MGKTISAGITGLIFGLGLTIAEMTNPAKVLAFLDLFGNWDPSLALVMGAAFLVTLAGYRLSWLRKQPVFAEQFQIPGNRQIDSRLAIGALLFGIGWGLAGLCPGPAIAALGFGGTKALMFIAAVVAGVLAYDLTALKPKTAG